MKLRQFFSSYPYQFSILVADIIGFYLCVLAAYWLRLNEFFEPSTPFFLFLAISIFCLFIFDSYSKEPSNRALRPVIKSIIAIMVSLLITLVCIYLIGRNEFTPLYGRGTLPVSFAFYTIFCASTRYFITRRNTHSKRSHWLYIGNESGASWLKQENKKHINRGRIKFEIINTSNFGESLENHLDNQNKHKWQNIIIHDFSALPNDIQQKLIEKKTKGWPILSFSEFVSKTWTKIPILHIEDQWIMDNDGFAILNDKINIHCKKLFDMITAIVMLILVAPIMLIVAILIPLDSKGSIFFNQKRVGLHGQFFKVYKFRTMTDSVESTAKWAQKNDARITRLGMTLRKFRLDELPQIFNVLKGDMSFIGPRPEQPEFVEQLRKEIPYYDLRHTVKPGITGWAQVVYQYGASVEQSREKLEYDLFYVKNQSMMLDALIVAKTCKTIIYAQGQ